MISIYCSTDDWSPTIQKILEKHPYLNDLDVHFSINSLSHDKNKKTNLLVLQESPAVLRASAILNFVYSDQCPQVYTKVYSCIKDLQKFPYVEYIHPSNRTWIVNPEFLPIKNKLISMISSSNSFLPGHQFRLNILNKVKDFVDVYGRGFNYIQNKEQGMKDYYYSIAIENDNTDNYFSEKLIDCFMLCTIPIYWGCNYAYEVFDKKGMISLNSYTDLNELKKLDKSYYYDNIDSIVENYFIAQKENRYMDEVLLKILMKMYYENNHK